jgi:hypothetical protein
MLSLQEWIEGRRVVIDTHILKVCENIGRIDDDEREDWVINNEFLYTLAIEEGVDMGLDD